jgi:hypothetical protein
MKTKICSKCKIEKKVCEFNTRKNSKDGYRQYCKICHLEYSKKYVKENYQKYKKYQDLYHLNNVEIHRLKSSEYYKNNKEKVHEYLKNKYKHVFCTVGDQWTDLIEIQDEQDRTRLDKAYSTEITPYLLFELYDGICTYGLKLKSYPTVQPRYTMSSYSNNHEKKNGTSCIYFHD